MPGARCARSPVCRVEKTHTSIQVTPESPGIPRAMVYGFFRALPGVPGLFATVIGAASRQLDTSVGVPGPHDFSVRSQMPSSGAPSASTASRPAFVDVAQRPFGGTGRQVIYDNSEYSVNTEYFFGTGLDAARAVGSACGFLRDLPDGQQAYAAARSRSRSRPAAARFCPLAKRLQRFADRIPWRRRAPPPAGPASARLAGPISSARLRPRHRVRAPIAISSDSSHGSIAIPENPASPRMPLHARFARQTQTDRDLPARWRQLRHMLVDRLQRRHDKRIFARLPPAGKHQPPRWPQRLVQIGKRERGLGEEHHAEARGQQVEACRLERVDGRVRQHEFDREARRRDLLARAPASAPRFDAEDVAARRRPVRQVQSWWRRQPQPTSRIRSPGFDADAIDQDSATGASTMSWLACRSAQR